jgi:hypothetical protein
VLLGGAYYLWKAPPLDQYPFEWGLGAALLVLVVGAIFVDRFGSRLMDPGKSPLRNEAGLQRARNLALALVAAVAFLTVAVYSVLATYARNLKDPLVSPAAVIESLSCPPAARPEEPKTLRRSRRHPICGRSGASTWASPTITFIWPGLRSCQPRILSASRSGTHD